ncbi:hypothetical protein LVD15_08385 [Fulvivirga maritima]|uniref:hypothetical protein n=1 Tax=Fulvivirga maritima TaxID=2904247 RepID=UPI001F2495D3|nr:hypothetical protein [Fulvivirga maritima]UII28434.1 hypothetical protein LVD15_08385 [Fulvivirga maritima]
MEKKRVIKSLENLDSDLKTLLKKRYPDGFENSLMRLTNAKNEPFFVVPLETEDTMYLVKIAVTRNSEGEYDLDVDDDADGGDDDDLDVGDEYDPDFEG